MGLNEARVQPALKWHRIDFDGTGGEYFRIWIVNLVLTILTLGIYGAWAKVRTWRYFYGNTRIGQHALDYHGSPVRILIGRLIAIVIVVAYAVSTRLTPYALFFWAPVIAIAFPWLVVSSLRFNARNTSYRNVRLNFNATYWHAVWAYVVWPILAILSLGLFVPLMRRAQDYFYINHHSFGGRPFRAKIPAWRIYLIFVTALLMVAGVVLALIVLGVAVDLSKGGNPAIITDDIIVILPVIYLGLPLWLTYVGSYLQASVVNLALSNTTLDAKHRLESDLEAFPLLSIAVGNAILLVITLGLYYPWAVIKLRRYMTGQILIGLADDIEEYTSEVIATQGAIGEEVAAVFDINIGL
jgi:uncharacterized membrane protein YjgN (DUF898 family)